MSAFPIWTGADGKQHQYYMATNPVTSFPADSAMGHGCVAVKRELKYLGFSYGSGFDPETPLIGAAAAKTIAQFQAAKGLTADGQAGPKTCKALFMTRVFAVETTYGIPDHLLAKGLQLESAYDPAARGYVDPRDRGLAQINAGAHPEVSDEEADDPAFAIVWYAEHMKADYDSLKDWDAALAAHNIGYFYAKKWLLAGKPASGIMTSGGKDIAKIATDYVQKVRSQAI